MAEKCQEEEATAGIQLPGEICQRLENIELDEDETESLLEEALELNKRLKAELKRIENEEQEAKPQRESRSSANKHPISSSGRRPGQKTNPLPPIAPRKGQPAGTGGHRKGVPARSQGQREKSASHSSPAPHATVGRISTSAGSIEASQRRIKSAKKDMETRPTRSAEQRKKKPEWNDRFSYE
ncbi:uncharacterized protein [Diadema setosum]|uniref:uncharacterized protein n=1 Tax=Diadema setosum TaxID=31175 RepID=UPI003B3A573E